MRVAITGVSGFIGSVLARRLHEAGRHVTGLVRPTSRRDHIEPHVDRIVVGDQADPSCWPDLLEGADAVVHSSTDWSGRTKDADFERYVRSNLLGSLLLLRASAPRPFVFMSSVSVHCDMRPRWKGLIDEDHPTRPGDLYGAYKAAVEAFLWAERASHDRPCVAIRPAAVYGIDPKLERSIGYPIVEKIRAGQAVARSGGGKFVHVDDVAGVTLAVLGHPGDAPPVINMADCYARWSDWAKMTAEILGVAARIDESSPPAPKNTFSPEAARSLGVALDRGHEGIRQHLRDLIERMDAGRA